MLFLPCCYYHSNNDIIISIIIIIIIIIVIIIIIIIIIATITIILADRYGSPDPRPQDGEGGSQEGAAIRERFKRVKSEQNFRNIPEESKLKQRWVFGVEQKFRGVLVLTPSKVTHLNLSPRRRRTRRRGRPRAPRSRGTRHT